MITEVSVHGKTPALLAQHDWIFSANGAEVDSVLDGGWYYPGDPSGLTPGALVRVRYVGHRVTRAGVVYTWARVPGGRFCAFERAGLPPDLRRAPVLC